MSCGAGCCHLNSEPVLFGSVRLGSVRLDAGSFSGQDSLPDFHFYFHFMPIVLAGVANLSANEEQYKCQRDKRAGTFI